MKPIQLPWDDPRYPGVWREQLGDRAPPVVEVLGEPALVGVKALAFFSSQKCPGRLVSRAYDLAQKLRDAAVTVIGGFHSPMERECLRILLQSPHPVLWCPARGLPRRLAPESRRALGEDGCWSCRRLASRCTARRRTLPWHGTGSSPRWPARFSLSTPHRAARPSNSLGNSSGPASRSGRLMIRPTGRCWHWGRSRPGWTRGLGEMRAASEFREAELVDVAVLEAGIEVQLDHLHAAAAAGDLVERAAIEQGEVGAGREVLPTHSICSGAKPAASRSRWRFRGAGAGRSTSQIEFLDLVGGQTNSSSRSEFPPRSPPWPAAAGDVGLR